MATLAYTIEKIMESAYRIWDNRSSPGEQMTPAYLRKAMVGQLQTAKTVGARVTLVWRCLIPL